MIKVGDIKQIIKDLPDDMPVFIDDKVDFMALLSIHKGTVPIFNYDLDDDIITKALVLGIT